MRFTLRVKLMAAFAGIALVTSLTAVYILLALRFVNAEYLQVTNTLQPASRTAGAILAGIHKQIATVEQYWTEKDPEVAQQFTSANAETRKSVDALLALAAEADERETAEKIKAHLAEFADVARRLFALVDQGKVADALGLRYGDHVRLATALSGFAQYLVEKYDKKAAEEAARAQQTAALAETVAYVVVPLALAVALGAGAWLAHSIAAPVRAAAAAAQRLAAGDLTVVQLRAGGRDEVAEMATSFNQMLQHLRQLVEGVSASTQSVLAAAADLSAASDQAARAAQGAAQAMAQVASGTSEQARAADEVQTTVGHLQQTIQQIAAGAGRSAADLQQAAQRLSAMAGTMEEMAAHAGTVAERARQATRAAEAGAAAVGRTEQGMGRIREAVGESVRHAQRLEQLSARIGDITGVISGIADQTSLLALNAAIEAARAGEHGRGFAVVAEEVRKLAERSAHSAKEIASLIQDVQSWTAAAVQAMEAGMAEVARGGELAAEAGRSLQEILATAGQAAAEVESIAGGTRRVQRDAAEVVQAFDGLAALAEEHTAATEEMAAGAGQVTKAVDTIAHVSQDNAAAAEETSAAVEELTASAEQVASSAQSLAQIARDLQRRVAQFKL